MKLFSFLFEGRGKPAEHGEPPVSASPPASTKTWSAPARIENVVWVKKGSVSKVSA